MNKNLLLNGLKTLIVLGLLCSLVVPAATLAQVPSSKAGKLDALIVENVKPVAQPDELHRGSRRHAERANSRRAVERL